MSELMTHDYGPGHRVWGHDYAVTKVEDGGQRLEVSGWSSTMIRPGDAMLLTNGDRSTRYRVESIRWAADPLDMFHAVLEFAPRPPT